MIINLVDRFLRHIIRNVRKRIRLTKLKYSWRLANKNNQTIVGEYFFDRLNVQVGAATYGRLNIINNTEDKISIGNFVSIADNVVFIVGGEHRTDYISTFPFKVRYLKAEEFEASSRGGITVEDDVWIGYGAIILSGVNIGKGAVIAAGAVVAKDVPSYAIIAGVPAKVLRYRFDEETIKYLETLNYSSLSKDLVCGHVEDLYKPINKLPYDTLKKRFDWFPKNER